MMLEIQWDLVVCPLYVQPEPKIRKAQLSDSSRNELAKTGDSFSVL